MARSVEFSRGNFEKIFILTSVIAAMLITYVAPNNISFLNFFRFLRS